MWCTVGVGFLLSLCFNEWFRMFAGFWLFACIKILGFDACDYVCCWTLRLLSARRLRVVGCCEVVFCVGLLPCFDVRIC